MDNNRSTIARRNTYQPQSAVELFIVPLIADAIHEHLQQILHNTNSSSLLDVGCGRKPFREFIRQHGVQYFGMDVIDVPNDPVDYIGAIDTDISALFPKDGMFDFILCTEVLEHVADWDKAFFNFSRLLKDNGILIMSMPQFYPPHEEPYDFWRPTSNAIKFYCERHHFTVSKIERLGNGWDVLGTLLGGLKIKPKSKGISSYLLSSLVRLTHFVAAKLLSKRIIHKYVECSQTYAPVLGDFYMNTFALAKRKCRPGVTS